MQEHIFFTPINLPQGFFYETKGIYSRKKRAKIHWGLNNIWGLNISDILPLF